MGYITELKSKSKGIRYKAVINIRKKKKKVLSTLILRLSAPKHWPKPGLKKKKTN